MRFFLRDSFLERGRFCKRCLVIAIASVTCSSISFGQQVKNLIVSPIKVIGGSIAWGTVRLDAPAPNGGQIVNLVGSGPEAIVASSTHVPQGEVEAKFCIRTLQTTYETGWTLTANAGASSKQKTIAILPYSESGMTLFLKRLASYGLATIDLEVGNWSNVQDPGIDTWPYDKSPAGTYATVTSYLSGSYQVWLMNMETCQMTQITSEGVNWNGQFSPDGKRLLFVHADGGWQGPNGIVQCYEMATGQITTLMDRYWEDAAYADWLPDGSGFVYVTDSSPSQLWRQPLNGSATLVGTANLFGNIQVSPDGRFVAFHGNDTGSYRVEQICLETGEKSFGPEYGLGGLYYAPDGSIYYSVGGIRRWDPQSQTDVSVVDNAGDSQIVYEKGALKGLSTSTASVFGGQSLTGTVVLDSPAPATGRQIELYADSDSCLVPESITVPPGTDCVTFPVQTTATSSNALVRIHALRGAVDKEAQFTINRSLYTLGGFQQPINDPIPQMSVFKKGRTVPVKFRLTDYAGQPVANEVATIALTLVGQTESPVNEETFSTASDTGINFRYSDDGQYIYNLSTRQLIKGAMYRITATVPSTGQSHSVLIGIN